MLDLVQISPEQAVPVCKIFDYGKYKYQQQKKLNKSKKTVKAPELKEIQIRPNIDIHDYNVKLKAIIKFLQGGHKVKIRLKFKGRELSHQEHGMQLLHRIIEDCKQEFEIKIDKEPKLEGRNISMVISK